jgi:putative transposase
MSRTSQIFVEGLSAHIIRRGVNRGAIYRDDFDRLTFLRLLADAAADHGTSVHGYVLMDTHYHLLVTPRHEEALPETMKALGDPYVRYYNWKHDRIGTLWSGRYRAIPIDTQPYWLMCLRYIEHNPVRAGMVTAPEEYRWSSYRAHAFGERIPWLVDHDVYRRLGASASERQAGYRMMCQGGLTDAELALQRHPPPWRRQRDCEPGSSLTESLSSA